MLAFLLRLGACVLFAVAVLYAQGWVLDASTADALTTVAAGLLAWCASTLDRPAPHP